MKITIRGRVSRENEELERRRASTQRNVYLLSVEPEEGFGRPQNERIEVTHDNIVYRLEFDREGLVLSGHQDNGLPIKKLIADFHDSNTVIIKGVQ